jgi:Ran GTPase-activating protein (RanGAP) involved in mRNA processing and transport
MISINDDRIKRLETRSYDISKEPLTHRIPISIPDENSTISLEQAIVPLLDLLPNVETFVCIVKDKCANPADGLTVDESASIMLYSMDWQPTEQCLHYVLNSALRSEDRQQLKPWLLYLRLLIKSLSHLPSLSLTVYRQVEVDLIENYSSEKTFIWWAFSLCSLSFDTFQSNEHLNKKNPRTIFSIECHSGKDIRKHSYYSNEDQILLMAASKFQIISSLENNNNQHIIHLKEIPSVYPLLQLTHVSNRSEILSASLLLNISETSIQSRSRVETIEKYIDRLLKLQMKISNYPLYSSIDLTKENLDDQDISLIIQHAIIKKQCSILRLDKNLITSEGITILVNSLHKNNTLIGLNLYSNRLFDKGLYPLVKLLSNNYSVLQKLHLGSNKISNEGALLLSEMLKTNTILTVLWLDNNRISDEGIHFLSNALIHQNKTLKELSLKKNKFITSLSLPYFIEILQYNQSLTQLDITKCSLTRKDNQYLENLSNENKRFLFELDMEQDDCVIS